MIKMKKLYIKLLSALLLVGSATSCGDSFLDSKLFTGVDTDQSLTSVHNIGIALNGTYYIMFRYDFAGNYATSIGDIASDLSYHNGRTSHFTNEYRFVVSPTDSYLTSIWSYGYRIIDSSTRIIVAGEKMAKTVSEDEKADLDLYLAEAYALRAYSQFVLVNMFGHQVKVNGQDFSDQPGIVVVESPVEPESMVKRSTVGKSYEAINSDITNSLKYFEEAGGDRGSMFYFNYASVLGLKSRVSLYLEKWQDAITAATDALAASGISELTYTATGYRALYNGGSSNDESMFALAITPTDNWSANSCGTLWTSYSYSPSPYLKSLYADTDVRTSIMGYSKDSTPTVPIYGAGKYAAFGYGNPAYGTNYLINAPEMYLNMAEAHLKLNDETSAKNNLLVVAKRNTAITSTSDLPSGTDAVMSFIKDERARELFQEGFRLFDLRRWNATANFYATGAPDVDWLIKNYNPSDLVFPIPADEINAGFGVEQTPNWRDGFPQ